MSTTYTEHLQLPKHDPKDPFNIALINEGFDKTEAGILMAFRGRAAYNLLDNSNFRNPVNQRGQTTYTGNGYSIDRWRAYHATTTHTITASGIAVSATDNNPNIYQVLDPNIIDTNKTYTVAVCDSAGNVSVRAMKPTTAAYSPVCIYVSGSNILFRIIGVNTWRWAALYEGEYTLETLPSYVPKGYAAELAECQRYYQTFKNVLLQGMVTTSGTKISFNPRTHNAFRKVPTFTADKLTWIRAEGKNITDKSVASVEVYANEAALPSYTITLNSAADLSNYCVATVFMDYSLAADL